MNCREFTAVLDDHRTRSLSAARRADLEAHVAQCRSCADALLVDDALAREHIPSAAPPGLFEEVVERLERVPARNPERPSRLGWRSGWAIAASVTLLASAGALLLVAMLEGPQGGLDDVQSVAETPAEANGLPDAIPGTEPAAASIAARAASFELGRHYAAVPETWPVMAGGRTEVVQYFMWGCNPCYVFESHLERWRASAPDGVELVRVPVIFNDEARMHARAFYTSQALGKLDEMHAAFFTEIHLNGNRLDTVQALSEFFESFGVGGQEFLDVFESVEIAGKVERATELVAEQGITAVPVIVVGGRYLTSLGMAGSYEALFALVDYLVLLLRVEEGRADHCVATEASQADAGQGCRSAEADYVVP
jgi:protein dithiol oxidoreductase (disulfide-forming)